MVVRRKKSTGAAKKPSKRVVKLARKYKVKITIKRGSRRVYKTTKLILQQIQRKKKSTTRKTRRHNFGRKRSNYGSGTNYKFLDDLPGKLFGRNGKKPISLSKRKEDEMDGKADKNKFKKAILIAIATLRIEKYPKETIERVREIFDIVEKNSRNYHKFDAEDRKEIRNSVIYGLFRANRGQTNEEIAKIIIDNINKYFNHVVVPRKNMGISAAAQLFTAMVIHIVYAIMEG